MRYATFIAVYILSLRFVKLVFQLHDLSLRSNLRFRNCELVFDEL